MKNNIVEQYDTYFLNSDIASNVATQNNKVLASNKIVEGLQICYYSGDELLDVPFNCINVPLENIIEYFVKTRNRHPLQIDFTNSKYNTDIKQKKFRNLFNSKFNIVKSIIDKKVEALENDISNLKPNFHDTKLRIFIHGCRETVLIKHLVKNIANAASSLGFDVYLHSQENDLQSCSRMFYLEAMKIFNPHLTININHLNNHFLNDAVFNFVWFQDKVAILTDNNSIKLRKRDHVFHLIKALEIVILNKGIHSEYQPFCIDPNVYKNRLNIKRKKRIVYIGNSYIDRVESSIDKEISKSLEKIYNVNGIVYDEDLDIIAKKHGVDFKTVKYILGYLEKDLLILKLASLNIKYKFEIYGNGWGKYDILKSNYKGILNYGEDISKVYNEAMYAFVPGGYVLQQRTLEAAASGAVPIVYDKRIYGHSKNEDYFDTSLIFFNKMEELSRILNDDKIYNVDLKRIVLENSYENFIRRIHKTIKVEMKL